jgi:hypothetical protein
MKIKTVIAALVMCAAGSALAQDAVTAPASHAS